jgi:hypothetical protein
MPSMPPCHPSDMVLVEVIEATAATVAAAAAIGRPRGSSEPYAVSVALAALELPTGAATAVLGLPLMRGEFIPRPQRAGLVRADRLVGDRVRLCPTAVQRFVDRQGEHRPRQRVRRACESDPPHPGDRRRLTGHTLSDPGVDGGSACGREVGRVPRTHGAGIRDRFPPAASGCRRRLHQTPAGDADRLLPPRAVPHSPPAAIFSMWTPNARQAPPVHCVMARPRRLVRLPWRSAAQS